MYFFADFAYTLANDSKDPSILSFVLVRAIKNRIHSDGFMKRHRRDEKAFTRKRFFCFRTTCVMVLQKTLKSVQLHLHALAHAMEVAGETKARCPTAGAWTRARAKLRHTAFVELNEEILLKNFYDDGKVERFEGRRLLAIDGSVIALPSSQAIFETFGEEKVTNQKDGFVQSYAQAQCTVVYDLLNRLSLKAALEPYRTSELSQARDLLPSVLRTGDIVIADRGYANAPFMSCVLAAGGDFAVRLPRQSFKASRPLFSAKKAGASVICELVVGENTIGLPKGEKLRVRLVSLDIPGTGEREVIATSLLDEKAFPTALFAWLYYKRWGIETYYHQLKNRLDLENFSGLTVESVYQDFHAMLFISNYETILTEPARRELDQKKNASLPARINHSVGYHLIKEYALDLFFSGLPEKELLLKLTRLFRMNPNYKRFREPTPHNNTSPMASAKYRKRTRKITF